MESILNELRCDKNNLPNVFFLELDAPSFCNRYYFGLDNDNLVIRAFNDKNFVVFDKNRYHNAYAYINTNDTDYQLINFVLKDLKRFDFKIKDKDIYERIFKPYEDITDILES